MVVNLQETPFWFILKTWSNILADMLKIVFPEMFLSQLDDVGPERIRSVNVGYTTLKKQFMGYLYIGLSR